MNFSTAGKKELVEPLIHVHNSDSDRKCNAMSQSNAKRKYLTYMKESYEPHMSVLQKL